MDFVRTCSVPIPDLIRDFIAEGELKFETYKLDLNDENYLVDALQSCLIEISKEHIIDLIGYILRELANNAKKANSKRIYFEDIGFDIDNHDQYKRGMKNFKSIPSEKMDYYLEKQEEKGLYIRVIFKMEEDLFSIYIINNTLIKDEEIAIISDKKRRAHEFKSIDEALMEVMTNEEGAGLGIMITVLMLKKLGLSDDHYMIETNGVETITKLELPLNMITEDQMQTVNQLLLKEINDLPQFPDHILQLQNLFSNPDVDLKEISMQISRDPGLTAEILKFANSAMFSLSKRVSSLIEAIKFIGLKGLRNLIYSYGTQQVFSKRYDLAKMQAIWNHSYKVAFFAYNLGKKALPKDDLEDIYISGILHDLGRVVTFCINQELINKINALCHHRGISVSIIEGLTSGYNHAEVGALLAAKWNFPEKFIKTIRYHHHPYHAEESERHFVLTIYVANVMADEFETIEKGYLTLDKRSLKFLKIENMDQYKNMVLTLSKAFEKLIRNN
jgi:putative nucleotidyltransferase with HDIG domain